MEETYIIIYYYFCDGEIKQKVIGLYNDIITARKDFMQCVRLPVEGWYRIYKVEEI